MSFCSIHYFTSQIQSRPRFSDNQQITILTSMKIYYKTYLISPDTYIISAQCTMIFISDVCGSYGSTF